jgi:hypothetical protein
LNPKTLTSPSWVEEKPTTRFDEETFWMAKTRMTGWNNTALPKSAQL